jgi:hypothetical protein
VFGIVVETNLRIHIPFTPEQAKRYGKAAESSGLVNGTQLRYAFMRMLGQIFRSMDIDISFKPEHAKKFLKDASPLDLMAEDSF